VSLSPQRAYRALCPNCGGAVEFRSAASASAICSYCHSTLVREGEALRRIGSSAELFDDHSPLQLGVRGRHSGIGFELIGRLQLRSADSAWTEWHALFDNGSTGWLSEDNGAHVLAFDVDLAAGTLLPAPNQLRPAQPLTLAGQRWSVGSITTVRVGAAEGELPAPPAAQDFDVVDLRSEDGRVASYDTSAGAPAHWSVGLPVRLADLSLSGLREETAERKLAGRSIECPSCGASLPLRLDSTRSVACAQCKAVIDVAQGVGAELSHYAQDNGQEPQLPLGSTGRLALGSGRETPTLPWQIVGYLERCDLPAPGSDDDQTFWREYLLWNRQEGFAFLVDAEDGWSWMKPITGTPSVDRGGQRVLLNRVSYLRRWGPYAATTTYVLGEFYWQVQRGDRVMVSDYDGLGQEARRRLSQEMQGREVTWSAGAVLDASEVADAFAIPPSQRKTLSRDAGPSSADLSGWKVLLVLITIGLLLSLLLSRCDASDCNALRDSFGPNSAEYQQCRRGSGRIGSTSGGGGSWGGFSSGGGGHK
jgi:uncharacterized membrane protein YgcG